MYSLTVVHATVSQEKKNTRLLELTKKYPLRHPNPVCDSTQAQQGLVYFRQVSIGPLRNGHGRNASHDARPKGHLRR